MAVVLIRFYPPPSPSHLCPFSLLHPLESEWTKQTTTKNAKTSKPEAAAAATAVPVLNVAPGITTSADDAGCTALVAVGNERLDVATTVSSTSPSSFSSATSSSNRFSSSPSNMEGLGRGEAIVATPETAGVVKKMKKKQRRRGNNAENGADRPLFQATRSARSDNPTTSAGLGVVVAKTSAASPKNSVLIASDGTDVLGPVDAAKIEIDGNRKNAEKNATVRG